MQLEDFGIKIRGNSVGDYKTTCPKCSHTRKNKRDTCLSVTIKHDDAKVWKCHHCEWVGHILPEKNQKPKPVVYQKPIQKKSLSVIQNEKMFKFFQDRGINRNTVEDFGIFIDNQHGEKIAFPYLSEGETVNIKYRTYDKKFSQTPKAKRTLYNIDRLQTEWVKTEIRKVIFVEGEMDVLSMFEAGYTAVSLPDGAPQRVKYDMDDKRFTALSETDWLENATEVLIATDMDEAGQNLALELAHRFGKHRCKRVHFPDGNDSQTKDANETLVNFGVSILRECVENAVPYPIDGLNFVKDYYSSVFDIYDGKVQKPKSTGFPELDKIYQVMSGTFQLVTGIPNHGKSNFLDQLILNIAKLHQWKFAVFSPEHSASLHIRRLVEKVNEKPFAEGFTDRMTRKELQTAMDYLNERFYFIENKDAIPTIDWVLEKAKGSCLRYGINGLIIDPFNKISQDRSAQIREDEHIRNIIAKCQKFCISHNVTIWMVAHPHKLYRNENGVYNPPSLYEVAGSAHWNNMADVGFVVHRDFETNITKVIMRKVREQGLYGNIGECEFTFDLAKRIYKEIKREQNAPSHNIYQN
jgi:twinkle protein